MACYSGHGHWNLSPFHLFPTFVQNNTFIRLGWRLISPFFPLALLICCLAYPAAAQLRDQPPDCANPPAYDFTIGNPTAVTNYSGDYTFSAGNYHIVGTLHFSNGTFTIKPGTTFYVDGLVTIFKHRPTIGGYALIIGNKAHLVADGAVFL